VVTRSAQRVGEAFAHHLGTCGAKVVVAVEAEPALRSLLQRFNYEIPLWLVPSHCPVFMARSMTSRMMDAVDKRTTTSTALRD